MTHPTKAIAPILLEDMRKVAVERKGESNFFTSQMIKDCMKKVIAVTLHQSVMVDPELEIKAYYAGHVLGAAMFWVRVGSQSIVYTGDYNMTPDRHLGAAWIDKCRPDLLISESTYATTIRDSKRCRERDFLKKVRYLYLLVTIDRFLFQQSRADTSVLGPRMYRPWWKSFDPRVRPWPRSRIMHTPRDILGKNELKSTRLLCAWPDREGQ